MKPITILLFLLLLCFATAVQAQAQAPKPDPALKKLSVFVGHWTYEGETKAGPWGPGIKDSGEYDGQMILGGFFFQGHWAEKGAMGALEIEGYDPDNKNFINNVYWDDGTRLSGEITVNGRTWTWTGKGVLATKPYKVKGQVVLAADFTSYTETFEVSADSKTWIPFFEYRYNKVKPAPKK